MLKTNTSIKLLVLINIFFHVSMWIKLICKTLQVYLLTQRVDQIGVLSLLLNPTEVTNMVLVDLPNMVNQLTQLRESYIHVSNILGILDVISIVVCFIGNVSDEENEVNILYIISFFTMMSWVF